MIKTVSIEKTKKGHPALWEKGGGFTNTGEATIIADSQGRRKKPVYIRRKGTLSCAEHALLIIKKGDLIIESWHHRQDFNIAVYEVSSIGEEEATLKMLHYFSEGEWDIDPPQEFLNAIEASKEKATHYHCRVPYFVLVEER